MRSDNLLNSRQGPSNRIPDSNQRGSQANQPLKRSVRKSRRMKSHRSLVLLSLLRRISVVRMSFVTVPPSGAMILAWIFAKNPRRVSLGGNILARIS